MHAWLLLKVSENSEPEMLRHDWNESAKSSGSHIDPEKDEMEGTKTEIESKMTMILKLIKNENQDDGSIPNDNSTKESELVTLVEDFHKQYQSLYALCDNLRGELKKNIHDRKENEGSVSSRSSSDSDYYSSEEIESTNWYLKSENQKVAGSIKQKLNTANLEVAGLKNKLASTIEEKEALNSEYVVALSKIQETEIINNDLDERERELSALVKMHQVHGNEASAQIKELEGQLKTLKVELESLRGQKRDLEARIEHKATGANEKGEKNRKLHARILELELRSKEKGDEVSALQKKLKANEESSMSKIADLMAQSSNLQLEVNSLRAQRGELEERAVSIKNETFSQIKGLMDQVNVMQPELESLLSQKTELELQLDRKTNEHLNQMETLEAELARRTMVEQRMLEERDGFIVLIKDLELEVNSLRCRKNELEEQIETVQVGNENEELLARNSELERKLSDRGNELSGLEKKFEIGGNESSSQIVVLTAQVNNLQQELASLQTQKSLLEELFEREKQESSQSLTQMENQNIELTGKIADQQRILKEREYAINKLNREFKQVKGLSSVSKFNLIAERKMEEIAGDFRKNIEDKIRLLGQRILVSEQLHTENKDYYKIVKGTYEQQNKELKERVATYEAELRKTRDISETANNAFTGLDLVVRKFEKDSYNFLDRISKTSNELQAAKTWAAGRNNEMKRLKHNVEFLAVQLDGKEEKEFLLREKVWNLEAKASKEGDETLNLKKKVSQLEKKVAELEKMVREKDEGLQSLGEEKREAIRQLCLLIDYQRGRCNHYKGVISKLTVRRNTTA